MQRIVLTMEDLVRTRIVELGPMAETHLSLQMLQSRHDRVLFDAWRRRTGPRVPHDTREAAPFLANPSGFIADLYTPLGPVASMEEGRDRLLGVPPGVLRSELTPPEGAERCRPRWLADPGRRGGGLDRLADALSEYHDAALAPYWHRIRQHVRAHVSLMGSLMATGGIGAALKALAPVVHWEPPTLQVPKYRPGSVVDIHLNGRGLVLAPALFCGPLPLLFTPTDDGESILVYPVPRSPSVVRDIWSPSDAAGTHKALAALLGVTRAAVLAACADGATTTEIARRLDISPPGVSQHTGVLRQAGLITSTRHRNTMHHSLTSQGHALLDDTPRTP
ncbi:MULTISPECIES: ArsR/SmtB family transcription factor [Streptomyces]|uniref:ArsR/SmtB family transcription factor n=1 Tax=Streptomyces eurythermus TaxID=42237 RepID=A0ABW6YU47_9ACTN|nr:MULTISPECIES: winged helix-turn-helix domain-containing protein [Streptomyces]QIS69157.1 winged helix-turn-helix transcriptional regulator [Streptomyces sp. DSM 40868]